MALGARATQVVAMIMKRGLLLAATGVALGLAAAAAGARVIESMLFGITPVDPPTFATVAIGFAMVTLVASYFPARHATTVDPAITLRDE
jgi:ABC-type antimicrobial peptide transport system permease subunit